MADHDTERLIDAYLDGELSVERVCAVQTLLKNDPTARREYGPLCELLGSPEPIEVPDGLRARVLAAVHTHEAVSNPALGDLRVPRRSRHLIRLSWASALAASLALFTAGWLSSRFLVNPAKITSDSGPSGAPGPVTVVVSPWVLNGFAQGLATGGPANPVVFAVQGAAIEMLAAWPAETPGAPQTPAIRQPSGQERPRTGEPAVPENRIPIFPPIQRL